MSSPDVEDQRKSESAPEEPLPVPQDNSAVQRPRIRRNRTAPVMHIPDEPYVPSVTEEICVATPPYAPSANHHDFFSVLQSTDDDDEFEESAEGSEQLDTEDEVSVADEASDDLSLPHISPVGHSEHVSPHNSLNGSRSDTLPQIASRVPSRVPSRMSSRVPSRRVSRRGSFTGRPRGRYNPPEFDAERMEAQWNLLSCGRTAELPLYRIEDVPQWQRYNISVQRGYRAYYTSKQALKSLFGWHNETINVWTHFLSFIIFIALACALYATVLASVPTGTSLARSRAVYAFFIFGCLACTFNSSVYHLFNCHGSHRIMMLMGRLDFLGITVLIVASIIPPLYVLFHCQPYVRAFYITLMMVLGVAGVVGPWTHAFYEHAGVRVSIYLAMGFSGLIPCLHMVIVFPVGHLQSTIVGLLLMAGLYVTGVFFYMKQFPESMFPGKFDRLLSSHQLWHFFVSCAAFVHYFNCVSIYQMASISYGAC